MPGVNLENAAAAHEDSRFDRYDIGLAAEQEQMRRKKWTLAAVILSVPLLACNILYLNRSSAGAKVNPRAETTVVWSEGRVLFASDHATIQTQDALLARTQAELPKALAAWEKALGHPLPFKRPNLRIGSCSGMPESELGCAELGDPPTVVIDDDGSEGRRAKVGGILLHEIGHLLGVPHIQGDRLMDPVYQKDGVEAPTEEAVALALIAEKRRRGLNHVQAR